MSTNPNPITFYALLGIDPSKSQDQQDAMAASFWPNDLISATEGYNVSKDGPQIVPWLQRILSFEEVRPGADRDVTLGAPTDPGGGAPGQITVSANMNVVGTGPPAMTLYLRDLPNIGIQLVPTGGDKLPTVFFASDGRGYEVVVENLPVDVILPPGMIQTDDPTVLVDGDLTQFDVGDEDSLEVEKHRDPDPYGRPHPCPFAPAARRRRYPRAEHADLDRRRHAVEPPGRGRARLLLIPSPRRREYFEWARNDLSSFVDNPPAPGAIGLQVDHVRARQGSAQGRGRPVQGQQRRAERAR